MNPVDLEALVETGHDYARKTLLNKRGAELTATYLLLRPEGEGGLGIDVMVCPWQDEAEKIVILELVKARCHANGVTALCFVCEAWVVSYSADEYRRGGSDPPSQRPDRKEIVLCIATDGTRKKVGRWAIRRDKPGGPVRALLSEEIGEEDSFGGRIIDGMLPNAQ